jgi:hypothetical protein
VITPGSYSLVIYRKSTFDKVLRFKAGNQPLNLRGYTVLAQLWDKDKTYKVDSFQIDRGPDESGEVTLFLDSTQTSNLISSGTYDVKLIEPSGREYYWLNGRYTIKEGLTDD